MKYLLIIITLLITVNCGQYIESVHDGDTVRGGPVPASKSERLRLMGINTPEVGGRKGLEPYGKEATEFVKIWLANHAYEIVYQYDKHGAVKRGSYGRPLVYIIGDDNTILNVEIVRAGLSDIALYGAKTIPHLDVFKAALIEAKNSNRGIWTR